MKHLTRYGLFLMGLLSVAFATDNPVWGAGRVTNITGYDQAQSLHLGALFTLLQSDYFGMIFLGIIIVVPALFALHYMVIGPMVFSHDRKKIYVFNLFHRIVHWIAAVAFMILVPTGLVIIFGDTFGGGAFVRLCKDLHGIGTLIFAVVVLPMFFMWARYMFLHFDDIKWLMIMGGYLNKNKNPVPAGKFNSGQKTWFWLCTLGGIVLIITGGMMYLLDFDMVMLRELTGLSQIDLLRAAAIIHNVLGMATVILFFVHIYMSMFAIKGAVHSMISGYKEEEEVEVLHSSWYRQLKAQGKV